MPLKPARMLALVPAKLELVDSVSVTSPGTVSEVLPPAPVMLPPSVPLPETVKESLVPPPTRFSMLVNPPRTPLTVTPLLVPSSVPALRPVTPQVLIVLSPTSVLLPAPPSRVPLNSPWLMTSTSMTNWSSPLPPLRFSMFEKLSELLSVPVFRALTIHVLAALGPVRVSKLVALELPTSLVMFWKPPPMLISVPL